MQLFLSALENLFTWLISNSLMAAALALVILLVKKLFKKKLGARWQYLIWLLLVVRLILPWAPASSFSMFNVMQSGHSVLTQIEKNIAESLQNIKTSNQQNSEQNVTKQTSNQTVTNSIDISVVETPAQQSESTLISARLSEKVSGILWVFALLWLAGVIIIASYSILSYRRIAVKLNRIMPEQDEQIIKVLKDCQLRMKIDADIPVIKTEEVKGPTLFGFFNPKILMPVKYPAVLSS